MIVNRMPKPSDLLQGTLDLLILKTLTRGSLHGWAISKRIQLLSNDVLAVQQGSLYPALHRLEQQGWIEAEWRPTETGRMAKFYSLTRAGRTQMKRELANWTRLSEGINLQSDFSSSDKVRFGVGDRLAAGWGPLQAWYSAYFNTIFTDRHLFMQALDISLWRPFESRRVEHILLSDSGEEIRRRQSSEFSQVRAQYRYSHFALASSPDGRLP